MRKRDVREMVVWINKFCEQERQAALGEERARIVEVLRGIKAQYPLTVFPEPYAGCVVDLYTAAGCRLVCDNAIKAIEEEGNV